MRLTLIALLALGACTSQPQPVVNNVVQTETTNVTDDASPAPLDKAPIAAEKRVTARFRCMDGVGLTARFDNDKGEATVTRAGKSTLLRQQPMGSGISYSDGSTSFQGKGDNMTFAAPGQPPIACTAIR